MDYKCPKCGVVKTKENSFMRADRPANYQAYCKQCNNIVVKNALRVFKQKCIDYKGGKCELCGYDKCIAALEFHHLDPSKKEFGIAQAKRSHWNEVQLELNKCKMLCANCHRETHFDDFEVDTTIKVNKFTICIDCGLSTNKYIVKRCDKCHIVFKRQNIPSKQQLEQDMVDLKHNMSAIGRKYLVSDNAVRKWVKSYSESTD